MPRLVWGVAACLVLVSCRGGSGDASLPVTLPPVTTTTPTTTTTTVTSTTGGSDTSAPSTTTVPTTTPPTTTTTLPPLTGLAYEEIGRADYPILITARPGDDVALLAERAGRVRTISDGAIGEVILDIVGQVTSNSERGLLGLARHPSQDSRVFAHYSGLDGETVVSEFAFDGAAADPGSERVVLTVSQPASNHNGGMIQFGPDGALYLGLGDGGGAADQFGHGQNQESLLGGLVRIDVDSGASELWQYGLRNPWRFWIDQDDIWIGDVGQSSFEEVDLADVTVPGVNYGWPITEGANCFRSSECDTTGLTLPLVEIVRGDAGTCSITGGVVYRGESIPEMAGRFLFSDYCGGYLRSADREGLVVDHTGDVGVPGRVVSFGVDGEAEAYVLTPERILKLVAVR